MGVLLVFLAFAVVCGSENIPLSTRHGADGASLETEFRMALWYGSSSGSGAESVDTLAGTPPSPKKHSYQSGVEFLSVEVCNLAALGIGYYCAGFGTSEVSTTEGIVGYVGAYTILAPIGAYLVNRVVFGTKGSSVKAGCGSCLGSSLVVGLSAIPRVWWMWGVCALLLPPAGTLFGYHL